MFCYSSEAQKKTIIKKFGFSYDNDLQSYGNYDTNSDVLKEIDFLFSLDIQKDFSSGSSYLIVRGRDGRCSLFNQSPVVRQFLNFFRQ